MLSLGFSRAKDIDAGEMNARYFEGRTDGLRVGALARVVIAQV